MSNNINFLQHYSLLTTSTPTGDRYRCPEAAFAQTEKEKDDDSDPTDRRPKKVSATCR